MAGLRSQANGQLSAGGATWAAVVNNSVGSPAVWTNFASNTEINFPIKNTGNATLTGMSITLTNSSGRDVRLCPLATSNCSSNAHGTIVANGSSLTITATSAQTPLAPDATVTWSFRRSNNGTASGVSISAVVTNLQVQDGSPLSQ